MAQVNGIPRAAQDELAWRSHQRAAEAWRAGKFAAEVMHVAVPPRYDRVTAKDNIVREDTSLEALGQLRPVFDRKYGTITAGNSSPLTDGAAAVVLDGRGEGEGARPHPARLRAQLRLRRARPRRPAPAGAGLRGAGGARPGRARPRRHGPGGHARGLRRPGALQPAGLRLQALRRGEAGPGGAARRGGPGAPQRERRLHRPRPPLRRHRRAHDPRRPCASWAAARAPTRCSPCARRAAWARRWSSTGPRPERPGRARAATTSTPTSQMADPRQDPRQGRTP